MPSDNHGQPQFLPLDPQQPRAYPQQPAYGQSAYPQQPAHQQYRPPSPASANGWQQPHWSYSWAPPPPPPRRNTGSKVVLALIAVSAIVFFALVIASAITGSISRTRADVTVDHTPARATNPDAAPVDASNAQAVLRDNTLYAQGGLANGDCPAQDLGEASKEEQTRFYEALMGCLNDEWRPSVESAGYTYEEPGLVVFDSAVITPCGSASPGDGRTLAFYCPSDKVMYADVPQMRKYFGANDVAYAIVIGHEFGHHIQRETGVLSAFDDVVYDDFDNRLDLNRRVELQASCLGGIFLGAIAESYSMDQSKLGQLGRVAGSFGDEPGGDDTVRDHGSGVSNREWILTGYRVNDLGRCNTFSAPADAVD
ncbi:MAG: neutral zinc metallopeptidase [Propionibacteriales bacterium]|nr:neutral zinc metallopeptidase [Propionibacteriales bacterium]